MPIISKIRLTNVIYESGGKRFNDELFLFDGHNSAIVLENGGGKTVFIHTVLQAILPHTHLGDRKIKETLQLENAPAHIGIEWLINENPRRYLTTAVSLFLQNNQLHSYKYIYEYEHGHSDSLEKMPFVKEINGKKRPAYKEEISDYYSAMKQKSRHAQTFDTILSFHDFIENNYHIIKNEWESIVKINRDEGGIEGFFEHCKTTTDLYDRLLIPAVEDSISGHSKNMFADMFERQRDGFQMYRNLQNSMKEHRQIQVELDKYVTQFKQFSDHHSIYEKTKQRAKGLFILLNEQQEMMNEEQLNNRTAWEEWVKCQNELNIKETSLQIAKKKIKEQDLESKYLYLKSEKNDIENEINEKEQYFHSLKHAKLKKQLQINKQSLKQYERELNEINEESSVDDYESQLEIEHAKLHGYYLTEIDQLEKTIETAKLNMQPIQRLIENLINKKQQNKQIYVRENDTLNQLKGQVSTKIELLESLKQQLLANPEQEKVTNEFSKWTTRYQFLDDEIIRLKQLIKTSKHKLKERESNRTKQLKQLEKINLKLNEVDHIKREQEKAHTSLHKALTNIKETWKRYDDLYLKQSTIKETLNDSLIKLQKEREELLLKERLVYRFVDDYGNQTTFFSDPFLMKKLDDWKNQFYVTTGTEFFATLTENEKEIYGKYKLWPLTLITTEENRNKLTKRLDSIQEKLQFPITIFSLEEAKYVDRKMVKDSWVIPTHWQTNLNENLFKTWQEDLLHNAENITNLRLQKENELSNIQNVLNQFEQFFTLYPFESVEALYESIRSLNFEKEFVKRTMTDLDEIIEQLQRDIDNIESNISELNSELNGLEQKLNMATMYLKEKREINTLKNQISNVKETIDRLMREQKSLDRSLADYENEKTTIENDIRDNQIEITIIKGNDVYKEVRKYKAIFTNNAKKVIVDRREKLKLHIHGIQESYDAIVIRRDETQKSIKRINNEIYYLLQSFKSIDLNIAFPVDGERLLKRTHNEIDNLKLKLNDIKKRENEAQILFIRQQERVTTKIEQFEIDYPNKEIIKFEQNLENVKSILEQQRKNLESRQRFLQKEEDRINRELTNIDEAIRLLENFQEAHHFNSTTVSEVILSEKEQSSFSYKRIEFISDITNALRIEKDALTAAEEKIDRAKQQFHTFCRHHISERKLREMATEGIEIKRTYEDVLQFQENMLTTVERADQYARDYISKKDKEVQAFINSIHNHLINVTEQLRSIPNNTKVKFGDKWRNIFHFTIPEWEEEDGKNRIRDNIDWILEQLESNKFKNEQGLEDSGKVRKHIEMWLDTRQLLQVVMNEKTMKVSCRKVTNDNKISRRLTSWEQSNQWSGGEKWSKNMTLFLGILNFVAEKKQYLHSNMKRHRAVILDNPFGKASSSHVLSPVFFIAEQLGFQIIALTAHADGKFLQDYFPINYSLKLRATTDSSKQVMTKEKSLHHAYFQDHESETMKRLEEHKQIELF